LAEVVSSFLPRAATVIVPQTATTTVMEEATMPVNSPSHRSESYWRLLRSAPPVGYLRASAILTLTNWTPGWLRLTEVEPAGVHDAIFENRTILHLVNDGLEMQNGGLKVHFATVHTPLHCSFRVTWN
jgi:hypothetical protein